MGRVFVTGDKHGDFTSPDDYQKVKEFCEKFKTTKEDYMIVLGDHGVRYFDDWRDYHAKKKLAKLPIRFILLRGNHDKRVNSKWKTVTINNECVRGQFIEDPDFDILYTQEYGWYEFCGKRVFVICGAYSVDKWYRIDMNELGYKNYLWFVDEQLSFMERAEAQSMFLHEAYFGEFSIMSHTCPTSCKPYDKFLDAVDQSTVDNSTEDWMEMLLGEITRQKLPLNMWYCGHYHVDRTYDPVRFMYHDIILFGETNNGND